MKSTDNLADCLASPSQPSPRKHPYRTQRLVLLDSQGTAGGTGFSGDTTNKSGAITS